jgi:hypothetical protein
MYVQHSIHIERAVDDCARLLAEAPRTWFPRLGSNGDSKVGFRFAGVTVRKRVRLELGAPLKQGDWTEVPFTWRATFPERLFPVMVGKVELLPVDRNTTRLAVSGMYEPPLGKLGAMIDDAVMHGIAEATVKELALSLERQISPA